MKFPYALSNFATLMREGYFYQDRTDRIPQLETTGRQLIFIRPRRFGKSLLVDTLAEAFAGSRELFAGCIWSTTGTGAGNTRCCALISAKAVKRELSRSM